MFDRSVPHYDVLYAFKDYKQASVEVHQLIQQQNPGARTLLDVACGTGGHLQHLQHWYACEGLDISSDMVREARLRCATAPITQADMADFNIGQQFDAVTCLFSSIGYVVTLPRMRSAVASMSAHLAPGGVLVVEPWITPERYVERRLTTNISDEPGRKIVWMYVSERVEDTSVFVIHYLVGDDSGVEYFEERHVMGLFTLEQYRGAFEDAGIGVEFDAVGPFGRGVLVGTKSP